MSVKSWFSALGLLILAGCTFPVRQQVDDLICERGSLGYDLRSGKDEQPEKPRPKENQPDKAKDPNKAPTLEERLTFKNIPGSEIEGLIWPDQKAPKAEVEAALQKSFPPLAKLQPDADFQPGPDGVPLTLSDLQRIAFANSPVLRQAASDIEAARGAVIQAGMYPNPTVGYQSNGAGPSGGPTYGMLLGQSIKILGKLKLAQDMAMMDLQNAEFAYRRAETDLQAAVRTGYYATLVAQESIRANRGLVELTDEVYRIMVLQLKGGVVGPYEPFQLAVFSEQARTALVQARNSRLLAWKQLASTLGVPAMPPTALAGNVHHPLPRIDFEKALAHVLTKHTDVLTTRSVIDKARYGLRLAEVAPYPDVNVQAGILTDATPPGPSRMIPSVQVTVPVPFFDRNQGGIRQAQAALVRANEEPHRVQADLSSRFSEAYRRYDENRVILEMYRKNILPKQVQAFRAAVKRYDRGDIGGVAFLDLVNSEQNLVTVVGTYLTVLQNQWQALVDVSSFLQTNQLYQVVDEVNNSPDVDFEALLKVPCTHPCAPYLAPPTDEGFRTPPVAPQLTAPVAPTSRGATFLAPVAASSANDATPRR